MTYTTTKAYAQRIDHQSNLISEAFNLCIANTIDVGKDKQWNVYQQVEHLTLITQSYYPIFDLLLSKKLHLGGLASFRFFANFIGKMILKSVQPNAKAIKTFPIWQPKGIDKVTCLNNFIQSQERLKIYAKKLEHELLHKAIIPSPANKSITYTLPVAFEIILDHQLRHLEQIKALA